MIILESPIETLRSDARNCRKLATMTLDTVRKRRLEMTADRYDIERELLEAKQATEKGPAGWARRGQS